MKRILILIFFVAFTFPAWAAWEYEEQADAMGRGGVKTALVTSTNTFNLNFPYKGEQHAIVMIRKHPKHGKNIVFAIEHGQLICDYDDCAITVRFDNNKPMRFSANKPADHSTTAFFLEGFDRFISSAKKSKRLQIEVVFFQQGGRILEFDITGLKWP